MPDPDRIAGDEPSLAPGIPDALWEAPVGVGLVDRELRFVRVNEALARLNGISREAHIGRTAEEVVPGGGALLMAAQRRALRTGEAVVNVEVTTGPEGEAHHSLRTFVPRRWHSEVVGVYVVATDITVRKRTEERLEASHERAARAAERLRRIQAITGAIGSARTVSQAAELVARHGIELVGARGCAVHVLSPGQVLRLVFATGMGERGGWAEDVALSAAVPAAAAARSGAPLWLATASALREGFAGFAARAQVAEDGAWAALPLRADGRLVGSATMGFAASELPPADEREYVTALAAECAEALAHAQLVEARDELARAVEERSADRERLVAELRAALHQRDVTAATLDAFFEAAPIGLAIVGRDLAFRRVNPALERIDGVAAQEHVGRRAGEVLATFPAGEIEASWREVLERGAGIVDQEVSGRCAASGATRHWRMSCFPVRGEREVLAAGSVVRDVTAELEAQAFQRHVVGIVGHDLRNPLSAVSASAHLLRARGGLTAEHLPLLDRIEASCESMKRIVADLLDVSLTRAGQGFPVWRRPCDLSEVVAGVTAEALAAAPARRVEIEGLGDPHGSWDADRLAQAIGNLVVNALAHGDPGAAVRVSWRGGRDEVSVEVRNEGPPIPPAMLPHLFEPFRRGEGQRPGGGRLGLGLFIAREIARAHGGTIEVDSGAGRATTFTLRLPRRGARG